jgi:hypothetical protein
VRASAATRGGLARRGSAATDRRTRERSLEGARGRRKHVQRSGNAADLAERLAALAAEG